MHNTLLLPPFLNAPLNDICDDKPLVEFRLRMNSELDLIENDKFDPKVMVYDKNYQNSVAHSPIFMKYLQDVCNLIEKKFPKSTRIMEVGCGKGDFFDVLDKNGFANVTGYDTAYEGENKKIKKRYLSEDDKTDAELTILRHTLEHIPQPFEFLKRIKLINGNQGNVFIEVPDIDWIKENNAFYDVAYEHVNYFSLDSLTSLFGNKYLEKGHLFGGQYIYVIANLKDLSHEYSDVYKDSENWKYIDFNDLFPKFEKAINEIEAKISNKNGVFLWGGAGKAGTFLHHCKMLSYAIMDKLVFAVDINPKKVGKFLPSSHVKIASKDEFFSKATNKDFLIIANPIYTDEIMKELEKNELSDIEIFPL